MNVLFVVSECMPFAATGGLAEVAGSLPKELKKLGVDIKVIMPLYRVIFRKYQNDLKFVGETQTKLAWRKQYCGLYTMQYENIEYYFVDNKFYFDRDSLYSHYDDGERFAFFSKSVFDCIELMEFYPNIIHCHDHQTAMVTVYLDMFKKEAKFLDIKSVFTIHNIEYQGVYDPIILGDIFGIDESFLEILQYNGRINLMKAAIVCSDLLTTVSPRYAREITTAKYANGLDYIINANRQKLVGILNGIDYNFYNSARDEALYQNYNLNTIDKKIENKRALQKAFHLQQRDDVCLISIISRLATHKGMDIIIDAFEKIMELDVQIVVLGIGEETYERKFTEFMDKYGSRVYSIFAFDTNLAKQIYSGSDMFLMPSKTEPCGLSQMIACRYGTLPIVRATGGLYDSIHKGNGFVFKNYDSQALLLAIQNAVDVFKNNKLRKQMIRNAYLSDFTWKNSANAYLKEYLKQGVE